jgi:hypothetical protein
MTSMLIGGLCDMEHDDLNLGHREVNDIVQWSRLCAHSGNHAPSSVIIMSIGMSFGCG